MSDKISESELRNMKIGEILYQETGKLLNYTILRVPDGWVYTFTPLDAGVSSCFVPDKGYNEDRA